MSSVFPYCSVCIVMRRFEIPDDWVEKYSKIPSSSPILIPKATFATKVKDEKDENMILEPISQLKLEEVDISPLLVCSDCKVCVHSSKFFKMIIMLQTNNKKEQHKKKFCSDD